MADDQTSKTEQASDKRLGEARARGQFARSADLGIAAGLLAAGVTISLTVPAQARQIALISTYVFTHLGQVDLQPASIAELTHTAVGAMLRLCLPLAATTLAVGILVNCLQSGFQLNPALLGFRVDRINPMQGFRRLFSGDGAIQLVLDLFKVLVVALVLNEGVHRVLGDAVFYTPTDLLHLGRFMSEAAASAFKQSALGIGCVAAVHYLLQIRKQSRELMMTRQEVKEEQHASEGDPLVKNARRAMSRRLLQKQMFDAVATADVIVTNPTHYAVALRYERGRDSAPMVLAKGRNRLAARIKRLGAEHDVPLVENVAVARALYKGVAVGQPISAPLYRAVAEILTFVYRTHRYYFHQLQIRRASLAVQP